MFKIKLFVLKRYLMILAHLYQLAREALSKNI